jgi:hypothetical protein
MPTYIPTKLPDEDQARIKFQAMDVGQGQRRKRNMNDKPVQRRGCVVRQSPRTAQEDSKKEAGSQKHVVVHRTALVGARMAAGLGRNTRQSGRTLARVLVTLAA